MRHLFLAETLSEKETLVSILFLNDYIFNQQARIRVQTLVNPVSGAFGHLKFTQKLLMACL